MGPTMAVKKLLITLLKKLLVWLDGESILTLKYVPVDRIVEKIVEVEKIIPVEVYKEIVKEVEKIVERTVPIEVTKEVVKEVEKVVEKIVPVKQIQYVDRIVEVEKIVKVPLVPTPEEVHKGVEALSEFQSIPALMQAAKLVVTQTKLLKRPSNRHAALVRHLTAQKTLKKKFPKVSDRDINFAIEAALQQEFE